MPYLVCFWSVREKGRLMQLAGLVRLVSCRCFGDDRCKLPGGPSDGARHRNALSGLPTYLSSTDVSDCGFLRWGSVANHHPGGIGGRTHSCRVRRRGVEDVVATISVPSLGRGDDRRGTPPSLEFRYPAHGQQSSDRG